MLIRLLLVILVAFTASSAGAQCLAPHRITGQIVQVIETPGGTGNFRAISNYRPDGYPYINYGASFATLPPLMKEFVAIHECAHLAEPTSDEILANCRTLQIMRQRGLSSQQEQFIAQFHYNEGPLPPQYGGNGVVFWNQTIACAGPSMP